MRLGRMLLATAGAVVLLGALVGACSAKNLSTRGRTEKRNSQAQ